MAAFGAAVGEWVGRIVSQMPSVQINEVQSSAFVHFEPGSHSQHEPPQSTSVSSWDLTPSLQCAGVGFIVGTTCARVVGIDDGI